MSLARFFSFQAAAERYLAGVVGPPAPARTRRRLLLRQPDGPEGVVLGAEHLPAGDRSSANREHERELTLHRGATPLAASSLTRGRQHVSVDLPRPQQLDRPVVPYADPVGHDLAETVVSMVIADVDLVWELRDDNVRRDEREHGRFVATKVRIERSPHDLHVLL